MSKLILYNPNRFMVPVMLKSETTQFQVNILPHASKEITPDQISDSVVNLTDDSHKVLILYNIK